MSKKSSKIVELSTEARTDLVIQILAGELTVDEAADRGGVSVEEVATWRDLYLAAGRRHELQVGELDRRILRPQGLLGRTGVRVALGAMAMAALLLVGNKVVADYYPGCVTQTDFTCFYPTTPAKANQVNDNFSKVVDWIEQKLGPVGSANVVFGGTIGTGSSVAIALVPGGRITGVGRIVGAAGLVLRGATGNDDDLTVGADGMVTIPDLSVTNSLAIPGGLPITVEAGVTQAFTTIPVPVDLGAADGKRACFLAQQTSGFQDAVGGVNTPHTMECRVRVSGGQWQLVGSVFWPTDTLTCGARCITW